VSALSVGWRGYGFRGGYGGEGSYVAGGGFFIVALLRRFGVSVPTGIFSAGVVLAILAGLAIFVALRPRREPVEAWTPLLLASTFMVLLSPHFAWYFAWVLPLLCRRLRSEEHTSELQSRGHLVCRLLLEKKKNEDSLAF